jgi:hypothetical protein
VERFRNVAEAQNNPKPKMTYQRVKAFNVRIVRKNAGKLFQQSVLTKAHRHVGGQPANTPGD